MSMLLLRNARLLDGTGGPARTAAWLLIDGDRIAEVGWDGREPPNAADPLADLSTIREVTLVVKGGQVIVNDTGGG